MQLAGGAQLGTYQVVAPLGAGGMGEVYRAHDSKLGREVALKVLPDGFAQDPERVARFQREAQLLAALNHPNIGAIYGLEQAGEVPFPGFGARLGPDPRRPSARGRPSGARGARDLPNRWPKRSRLPTSEASSTGT